MKATVPTPSRSPLCQALGGHRFWPVVHQPGLSICLICTCTEWLPRVKQWRVWKRAR